ncbi:hypothetical protein RF11_08118 [Thelohanellus kitauei]|uniref:Brinker DNA-binding domain-containing protein n=1 Tax=Thelohanellus kitauei TaxID=669202 RepID=A0A0C2IEM1_THEKT|nr:hypothetical protein RF11_08118 [Thelohanellus kitauei]
MSNIRTSYTIDFKINFIEHAKTSSNRETAKNFGVDESMALRWRKTEKTCCCYHLHLRLRLNTSHLQLGPILKIHLRTLLMNSETRLIAKERISNLLILQKWRYNFMKDISK